MMKKVKLFFLCLMILTATTRADGDVYAALKKKEVNWRAGPGEKYPIQWVYREQGYPVKILDSYDIWRQVQDVSGSVGWVHKNMLTDRRTILVRSDGVLTSKPNGAGKTIAFVEPETIARVLKCPADQADCKILFRFRDQDYKGWFPRRLVWGLNPGEIID